MVRSIRKEQRSSGVRRLWPNFGLSLVFCGLFLLSWAGQGFAEWQLYRSEQRAHGEAVRVEGYLVEFGQSTLENWQSEFLQLLWQVVGLAYFLYLGSPSSHENDDRLEAKVDALLHLQGDQGKEIIVKLDRHFMRHPRERQPTVGDDELDRLLRGERPPLV